MVSEINEKVKIKKKTIFIYGPHREKTCLRSFCRSKIQTSLHGYRYFLENFKISLVASLHMKLSKKRITKVLIRLGGCAGWSTPVLLQPPKDSFSCDKAHMCSNALIKHS